MIKEMIKKQLNRLQGGMSDVSVVTDSSINHTETQAEWAWMNALNSKVLEALIREYGLHEVQLVQIDRRLHGYNYLIDTEQGRFYAKGSTALTPSTGRLQSQMTDYINSMEVINVQLPRVLKNKQGDATTILCERNEKQVTLFVMEYLPSLTRARDYVMHQTETSPFKIIGEFHRNVHPFTNMVRQNTNAEKYGFEYHQKYVRKHQVVAAGVHAPLTLENDLAWFFEWAESSTMQKVSALPCHGDFGDNIMMTSDLVPVILDFDNLHCGNPVWDLARFIAVSHYDDFLYYMTNQAHSIQEYNQASGLRVDTQTFTVMLGYALAYEIVECLVEFDHFVSIQGEETVLQWVENKHKRFHDFREHIKSCSN